MESHDDLLLTWVDTSSGRYPIYLGHDFIDKASLKPFIPSEQIVIITNETIAKLHLAPILSVLKAYDCSVCTLADGEQYKTLSSIELIYQHMLSTKQNRDTCVIALGGGVVGDMAGFAASSYQRGVTFIQIPTTLLAQVDASVGGKTGVNFEAEKNVIGSFYQPSAVLIDTHYLNTLADREYISGLAEVIKYALLGDAHFFVWLEENIRYLLQRDVDRLKHAIGKCCQMKAEIVAEDPNERGRRALLNLGHTFAHTIESYGEYKQWQHGEAVAIGLYCAASLSKRVGSIDEQSVKRVLLLLEKAGLPTALPSTIDVNTLIAGMKRDKKVSNKRLRFVLMSEIGEAYVSYVDDIALVRQVFEDIATI